MKKRRSEKNKANLKDKLNTPSEELHEAVEIIEELSDASENPNDDEQTELESEIITESSLMKRVCVPTRHQNFGTLGKKTKKRLKKGVGGLSKKEIPPALYGENG